MAPVDESPPLSGADVNQWASGLPEADAGLALVAAGIVPETRPSGFLVWRAPARLQVHSALQLVRPVPADRLAVEGNVIPGDIIPLLLKASGVSSAVLPVARPPGALRRRPWLWPLRVGVLGAPLPAKSAVAKAGRLPSAQVDLHDVAMAPMAVDVLFVVAPLDQVGELVARTGSLANAVVVLDGSSSAWPIIDAQLALLRAATSASVAALAGHRTHRSLAGVIGRLLRELSHAHPFDAALTAALGRNVLITGEVDVLSDLTLPVMTRRIANGLGQTASRIGKGVAARRITQASRQLEKLSEGWFRGEKHEAADIGPEIAAAGRAIDEVSEVRWLQCQIESQSPSRNTFVRGENTVHVFIGPADEAALAAGELSNDELGFVTPDITSVRVTVVVVPTTPRGEPMRAELDLPRVGRSATVRFPLKIPARAREASARILVLHRNRLLQTAVLSGVVGETARLEEIAMIRRDLTGLDDRRAFDVALFANHDPKDVGTLIANSSGHTYVNSKEEIENASGRLRKSIGEAALLRSTKRELPEKTRKLLIDIAVDGKDLLEELTKLDVEMATAQRIQIVSSRSEWFLPLELVYDRAAPDDDAKMCPSWLVDGSTCGSDCGTGSEDTKIVCPAAFWGMSKTIERIYYDPARGDLDDRFLVLADPRGHDRRLTAKHAVFGASTKVPPAAVKKIRELLDAAAVEAKDWDTWITAIESAPADLLLLMPHTSNEDATLEISKNTLKRGRISPRYVTGGHQTHPVVVLFGCDTTGNKANPAGFATRFLKYHAGLVFTSLTVLLNIHAAALAQRLAQVLRDPDRQPQPIGEVMTAFRRAAVRDGLPAALGLTVCGNTDWTV
ncbi:MAG: hypothetical protein QOF58_5127 [Pseudonocardiales bacterium]|nr:hypothetical protein [Pseudonocardiales bacterium]